MKLVRITLMGVGGVALAGLLLLPKAAHAIVATLVEVANTTANPVPNLDTERNARIPYQSTQVFTQTSTAYETHFPVFSAAPAGHRLVVQNASAYLTVTAGSGLGAPFGLLAVNGYFTIGLPGQNSGGFNYPITAYFDAGDSPEMALSGNFTAGFDQAVTLTGYLENCSITGCPPIQN
jgi:hypothetical protein